MRHGRGAGCLEEIGNGSMLHSWKSRVILYPEISFHCAALTKDRFGVASVIDALSSPFIGKGSLRQWTYMTFSDALPRHTSRCRSLLFIGSGPLLWDSRAGMGT